MEAPEQKQLLRASLIKQRLGLTVRDINDRSQAVAQQLSQLPAFDQAHVVGLYAATADEVQTTAIDHVARTAGKTVCYPRVTSPNLYQMTFARTEGLDDLRPGFAGIREPDDTGASMDEETLDCVVLPGVAFDRSGRRLGRGAGFYDRWLQHYAGMRIGLGFHFQIVTEVPEGPWDARLHFIVTEEGTISCRP